MGPEKGLKDAVEATKGDYGGAEARTGSARQGATPCRAFEGLQPPGGGCGPFSPPSA